VSEEELEAFYRDRSMLKRSVFPEDVAEATYFLAERIGSQIYRQHSQCGCRQPGRLPTLNLHANEKNTMTQADQCPVAG